MNLIVTTLQWLSLALLNICWAFKNCSPAPSLFSCLYFVLNNSSPTFPCLLFPMVSICSFCVQTSTHCRQQLGSDFSISSLRNGWLSPKLSNSKDYASDKSLQRVCQVPSTAINLYCHIGRTKYILFPVLQMKSCFTPSSTLIG